LLKNFLGDLKVSRRLNLYHKGPKNLKSVDSGRADKAISPLNVNNIQRGAVLKYENAKINLKEIKGRFYFNI
jgi:hypothetical protein